MLSTPRKAERNVLFAAVVLFHACTVTITAALICVPFNSSTTAGYPDDVSSFAIPTYFACTDGSFLTAVGATYDDLIIKSLSWTCSDGDEIGSISSDSTAEESVSFSVGITGVQTGVEDGLLPLLAEMYISGYNVGFTDDISFSWKGPFGVFSDDDILLPGTSTSYCGSNAFATGVTVWSSASFVYGVMLECATVTDTCHPPNYPTSLIPASTTTTDDDEPPFFTDQMITIFACVGGGLVLIAICCGVGCGLRLRRRRRRRRRENGPMARESFSVGPVPARKETGVPPPPSGPPPAYVEPPSYDDAPPPAFTP